MSVRSRTLDGACPVSRCARDRMNSYRATIIPGLQQGRRGLLSATFFELNAERFQSDVQRTGIREVVVKAGRLKLRLRTERGNSRLARHAQTPSTFVIRRTGAREALLCAPATHSRARSLETAPRRRSSVSAPRLRRRARLGVVHSFAARIFPPSPMSPWLASPHSELLSRLLSGCCVEALAVAN